MKMLLLRACLLSSLLTAPLVTCAANFSANFQDTDIHDFIDIVSQNLNKPVLVDPSVQGKISVRSYDMFTEEEYYQFFLSVLDLYGYSIVPMDNGFLKVIRSSKVKTAGTPVADRGNPGKGDEVITRMVQMNNVPARDLAPILRQLNDASGMGNVVHYEPSNVIILTGKATIVNRLVDVIERVDRAGIQQRETVPVKNGSAKELAELLNQLSNDELKGQNAGALMAKVVADPRTNTLVISGSPQARSKTREIVQRLDKEGGFQGSTRVFYLHYANATQIAGVLTSVSEKLSAAQNVKNGKNPALANSAISVAADAQTNSLIITAPQDAMSSLEKVIRQLDIRRSQVLVEAIIAEVQDGSGLNLGIQWNSRYGGAQFTDTGLPIGNLKKDHAILNGTVNGLATGFFRGDFSALLTALAQDAKSEILSTPSVVTLDNKEASFNAGQDVPVLSGSRTTTSDNNVFNTVERKTVGTRLKVTPQINDGNTVQLKIEQEVSSVDKTSSEAGNLGPTFNTRTISNEVIVNNGQTVVLGGLIEDVNKQNVSKVPLLGDIPLIGALFRYTSNEKGKRNLMVFIKTTIIPDDKVYGHVSGKKYRRVRTDFEQRSEKPVSDMLPLPDEFMLTPPARNPFRQ